MVSTESTVVSGAKPEHRYAVVVLDGDGVIRLASRGVLDLFNRCPEELLGQPVEWLVPARLRTEPVSQWHELAVSGLSGEPPVTFQILGLQREGGEFPIEVTVISIGGPHRRLFAAVIRDLADRRRWNGSARTTQRMSQRGAIEAAT